MLRSRLRMHGHGAWLLVMLQCTTVVDLATGIYVSIVPGPVQLYRWLVCMMSQCSGSQPVAAVCLPDSQSQGLLDRLVHRWVVLQLPMLLLNRRTRAALPKPSCVGAPV
jgi:hypothetical protein